MSECFQKWNELKSRIESKMSQGKEMKFTLAFNAEGKKSKNSQGGGGKEMKHTLAFHAEGKNTTSLPETKQLFGARCVEPILYWGWHRVQTKKKLWFFLKASDERPLKSGIKFYSEYKNLLSQF